MFLPLFTDGNDADANVGNGSGEGEGEEVGSDGRVVKKNQVHGVKITCSW
jgi:hypothetical protein